MHYFPPNFAIQQLHTNRRELAPATLSQITRGALAPLIMRQVHTIRYSPLIHLAKTHGNKAYELRVLVVVGGANEEVACGVGAPHAEKRKLTERILLY